MSHSDAQLERQIEAAYQRFISAREEHHMRLAMDEMRRLIAKRSPDQIQKMETAMGLI